MFSVLFVVAVVGVLLGLSYRRFSMNNAITYEMSLGNRLRSFLADLPGRTVAVFKQSFWESNLNWVRGEAVRHYPGWKKWVFFGWILSFLYLVLSGFGYVLFCPRGLFGLPLLLHVLAGGFFSVSLVPLVFWRARDFHLDLELGLLLLLTRFLFWVIVFSGFLLTATAWGSMLTWFSLKTQLGIIAIHRYSALFCFLSVVAFIHFSIDGKE
jgi:hypothetical protein